MTKAEQIEKLRDVLDRIARFAEAYDEVISKGVDYPKETVGACLCIVLGRAARKALNDQG